MKNEECYSDVEEEAKGGRNREAITDEEVWSPGLTLTPVCVGGVPPGQDGPSAAFGVEV